MCVHVLAVPVAADALADLAPELGVDAVAVWDVRERGGN